MSSVITLTTDFGLSDGYAASLKGVILGINPQAIVIDITHFIAPQNILQAAFVLFTTYSYFPEGTIHVVVVDPEVGSDRRAILLSTGSAYFIAPDNGILSYIIEESYSRLSGLNNALSDKFDLTETDKSIQAIVINDPKYWLETISATFHGRDVFAPVAAHLSLGLDFAVFGEPTNRLHKISTPRPYVDISGDIIGQILHVDNFGNLITNIRNQDMPQKKLNIEVMGQIMEGICRFYSQKKGLIALIGSSGYLEISLSNGSAADFLGAKIGNRVKILVSQ